MIKNYSIWYSSDEVRDFHPIVGDCLFNALNDLKLQEIYEVVHHFDIPGSTTIPDFAIIHKQSGKVVFIVEVKKTKSEVNSQRYWNQARGYVRDLKFRWKQNSFPFYCVTNIEQLIFFCERDAPISNCLLSGNPYNHGNFEPVPNDSKNVAIALEKSFKNIIELIHSGTRPTWINNWDPIVSSFISNYSSISSKINLPDEEAKDITLYEFLRLLFYVFLREYYLLNSNRNSEYFSGLNKLITDTRNYGTYIQGYFEKVLQLDFKQIFVDYPLNQLRLINQDDNVIQDFRSFVEALEKYLKSAVRENSSPPFFFNLLSSKIYDREELHNKGKVMTDPELASLLAELTLDGSEKSILDPGCGDGSLLSASYDKISTAQNLTSDDNHQQLLSIIHGREIDPFLTQLAAFRLLAKNFDAVAQTTKLDITTQDIFLAPEPGRYDAVLMNPPFLRNDDENAPISNKTQMISAINNCGIDCFVERANQPNLLYYFVNYAWHYLNDGGKIGAILMTKVLNNLDGEPFKEFIKNKIISVIQYPRSYFPQFKVTTCIFILSKLGNSGKSVKFVNIKDTSVFEDLDDFSREIRNATVDIINPSYTIKLVDPDLLNPTDNWRLHLIDPDDKYKKFISNNLLVDIGTIFKVIKRGQADNSGGTNVIYLNSSQNPLSDFVSGIEEDNVIFGLKNNRLKRNFILTSEDLVSEKSIDIPLQYIDSLENSTSIELKPGITMYLQKAQDKFGNAKWKKIASEAFRSTEIAQIIIPRADRTKHAIYLNTTGEKIVISSNFIYLSSLDTDSIGSQSAEKSLKLIAAYLLSTFGQIQMEILSNNQEGLRKFEKRSASKLKIINPSLINEKDIDEVIRNYEELNIGNVEFSGLEVSESPRDNLDLVFSRILFSQDNMGYNSAQNLLQGARLFLFQLVESRKT